ncbi:iron-sulfur cluster assembly scaffold protein [Collinsella tanakaei]|uniref:iron-sulfur cluster assembly scaffold protein n=1 Tax=Collinsella tanakaei TaxID=626935 RepID=UPI00195D8401|nr:iron-sulfur cluster assembly scaffold protein [Collinsella tanakaei]MBM6756556.1 iron-sulfur cluster assembly scaffold protein [Collinsella tanakaei]
MPKRKLTEDTPFLRTPDMYQIENDAPITEYSDKLLDLIADTPNGGMPDGANAFCSVGKEKRGTVQMQLFAVIDPETETFGPVGFRSHGCLAAIGSAAALAEMLPGKTFAEALAITKDEIKERLGGVPASKMYTLILATCAVKAVIGDYLIRVKRAQAELDELFACENLSVDCIITENCSLRDERVDEYMRACGEIE